MYKLRYRDEIRIIYKQDIFHCVLQKQSTEAWEVDITTCTWCQLLE